MDFLLHQYPPSLLLPHQVLVCILGGKRWAGEVTYVLRACVCVLCEPMMMKQVMIPVAEQFPSGGWRHHSADILPSSSVPIGSSQSYSTYCKVLRLWLFKLFKPEKQTITNEVVWVSGSYSRQKKTVIEHEHNALYCNIVTDATMYCIFSNWCQIQPWVTMRYNYRKRLAIH